LIYCAIFPGLTSSKGGALIGGTHGSAAQEGRERCRPVAPPAASQGGGVRRRPARLGSKAGRLAKHGEQRRHAVAGDGNRWRGRWRRAARKGAAAAEDNGAHGREGKREERETSPAGMAAGAEGKGGGDDRRREGSDGRRRHSRRERRGLRVGKPTTADAIDG
jgi:hypothetical protein